MRIINYHFDQAELEVAAQYLYSKSCQSNAMELAIGYLSLWGMNYPVVDIYLQDDGDFTACYRHAALEPEQAVKPAYVIGAVFDHQTKKYGFHS